MVVGPDDGSRSYLCLGFLAAQAKKLEVNVRPMPPNALRNVNRSLREVDELEQRLIELEGRMIQLNQSHDTLNRKHLELNEMKHVLRETTNFLNEASIPKSNGRWLTHCLAGRKPTR